MNINRNTWLPALQIVIIYLLQGSLGFAGEPCNERLLVHFDQHIYVAGEAVHYKVYRPGADNSENTVLYFTLSTPSNRMNINWRMNINGNTAYGLYRLPQNIPGGVYQIRAYTNAMRNNGTESFYTDNILILNLSEKLPDTLSVPDYPNNIFLSSEQKRNVVVDVSNRQIQPGENLQLNITNDGNDSAFLSLSITLETPFDDFFNQTWPENDNRDSELVYNGKGCIYNSESKGYILSGMVLHRDTDIPAGEVKILLAVTDSLKPSVLFARADAEGRFCFFLNKFYDNRELILQIADSIIKTPLKWIINSKTDINSTAGKIFILTKEQKKYLSQIKDVRLIEQVYNLSSDTVEYLRLPAHYDAYFSSPDRVVRPSEFVELANFREIDNNILPLVSFSDRGGMHYLSMFNSDNQNWSEDVLVLLNGVPFNDLAYISLLGTSQIKRIDFYTAGHIFGGVSYDGVIAIYTYDQAIPDAYLKNTFIYNNSVIPGGYKTIKSNNTNRRLPDFRDNLKYEPDIRVGGGKQFIIEFPASLLEGRYIIAVKGITASGSQVNITEHIEIKKADD